MAAKQKAPASPPTPPARFSAVVEAFRGKRGVVLEPGWGKGNLTLKAGGKIFVLLLPDALVAKLPKTRVDALVLAGAGTRFDPRKNGQVMKEWLVAGEGADGLALAREAHAFVAGAPAGRKTEGRKVARDSG